MKDRTAPVKQTMQGMRGVENTQSFTSIRKTVGNLLLLTVVIKQSKLTD